eukprot:UN11098
MTKGFGGMEVIEMAGLITALVFVGEFNPIITKKTKEIQFYSIIFLGGIPLFSYLVWFYIIIGYYYFGSKTQFSRRNCCSKTWRYCVGFLSCCFLLCIAPNKGLGAKVLKASKFRRWIMTTYFTTSYFVFYIGYHRNICLRLIGTELFNIIL